MAEARVALYLGFVAILAAVPVTAQVGQEVTYLGLSQTTHATTFDNGWVIG